MGKIVELDKRGRLLLPAEKRNKIGSKRFLLRESKGKLELEPLPNAEEIRGKYKGLVDKDLDELEEDQEEFVRQGER
ncbi:hypothetical protein AKJ65_07410 [candidate division MSBL1 archaeon SCGC-AAA259E19]|uniref:SpoVT-AbrB domain-containing protein n=2 Tax=candidate division MSBL1 TaxID=215777 RepID=A0A133UA52_9EURY|nr:hypothetical protein AKJ57_02555 [candidate division MSBL1 archaeon SCGC-AAA259A05]KXA92548.1 hypothetical protein AKJ65_07410 [candidate division MSBL1 archaeon SCGC-AAA259E19]